MTLDIIGNLYTPVICDTEGEVISGGEALPGWHVNTIPAVPEWEAYKVEPTTKRRVFSGMADETCCYAFPDEATFTDSATELGFLEYVVSPTTPIEDFT